MLDSTGEAPHEREGSVDSLFGPLSPEGSAPNIGESLPNNDAFMEPPFDSLRNEDISDDQALHDALHEALSAPDVPPKPQYTPRNTYRPPPPANYLNTTAVNTTGQGVSPYILTPPSTIPERGQSRPGPTTPNQNGRETGSAYSEAARGYINRSIATPSSDLSSSINILGHSNGAQLPRGSSTTPLPARVPLIDYPSDSSGEEEPQRQPSPPRIQHKPAEDLERSQKAKGHRNPPAQRKVSNKLSGETTTSPANQKVKEPQPTRKPPTTPSKPPVHKEPVKSGFLPPSSSPSHAKAMNWSAPIDKKRPRAPSPALPSSHPPKRAKPSGPPKPPPRATPFLDDSSEDEAPKPEVPKPEAPKLKKINQNRLKELLAKRKNASVESTSNDKNGGGEKAASTPKADMKRVEQMGAQVPPVETSKSMASKAGSAQILGTAASTPKADMKEVEQVGAQIPPVETPKSMSSKASSAQIPGTAAGRPTVKQTPVPPPGDAGVRVGEFKKPSVHSGGPMSLERYAAAVKNLETKPSEVDMLLSSVIGSQTTTVPGNSAGQLQGKQVTKGRTTSVGGLEKQKPPVGPRSKAVAENAFDSPLHGKKTHAEKVAEKRSNPGPQHKATTVGIPQKEVTEKPSGPRLQDKETISQKEVAEKPVDPRLHGRATILQKEFAEKPDDPRLHGRAPAAPKDVAEKPSDPRLQRKATPAQKEVVETPSNTRPQGKVTATQEEAAEKTTDPRLQGRPSNKNEVPQNTGDPRLQAREAAKQKIVPPPKAAQGKESSQKADTNDVLMTDAEEPTDVAEPPQNDVIEQPTPKAKGKQEIDISLEKIPPVSKAGAAQAKAHVSPHEAPSKPLGNLAAQKDAQKAAEKDTTLAPKINTLEVQKPSTSTSQSHARPATPSLTKPPEPLKNTTEHSKLHHLPAHKNVLMSKNPPSDPAQKTAEKDTTPAHKTPAPEVPRSSPPAPQNHAQRIIPSLNTPVEQIKNPTKSSQLPQPVQTAAKLVESNKPEKPTEVVGLPEPVEVPAPIKTADPKKQIQGVNLTELPTATKESLSLNSTPQAEELPESTNSPAATPSPASDSLPLFEYLIFQKHYTETDDASLIPAQQIISQAFTSPDAANAQAKQLIDTTTKYPSLYSIQYQDWRSTLNEHSCLTFTSTFTTPDPETSGLKTYHKIWVERHALSSYSPRKTPDATTRFINKTLYALRLCKLVIPDDIDDSSATPILQFESLSSPALQKLGGFAEVHTILDGANRAARRLQIALSHRRGEVREVERKWQEEENRKLWDKVHRLDGLIAPTGDEEEEEDGKGERARRGCWESEFNGLGGERYRLWVERVRVFGPRNV